MNLTVRSRLSPEELSRAVRAEVDGLDKDLPLENVRTLTNLVDSALAQRRLSVQLVAGFAGMALLLTAIGLYGVLAYNVGQRSREIGIRIALGARKRDVHALVLGEAMSFMVIGVLAGLAGAFALTRLLRSLLFGVTATDPLTYIFVPILLVVVALVACLIPARRAVRVDPAVALRTE
jgi:putative ABC transport system permease protein